MIDKTVFKNYKSLFRSELLGELSAKTLGEHAIEVEKGSKPPHHSLYHLSPAEQRHTKEYIEDLLNKGKIGKSKSPYDSLLFCVKERDMLRGVVDYHALKKIAKRNNAPTSKAHETSDQIGGGRVF